MWNLNIVRFRKQFIASRRSQKNDYFSAEVIFYLNDFFI